MLSLKRIFNIKPEFNYLKGFLFTTNPIGTTYGLARSVLATGTFMILIFNDIERMFPNDAMIGVFPKTLSLFYLLYDHLQIAKIIALAILLLVVMGWRPRFTGIFHWYVTYSIFIGSPFIDGGDQISSIITLLLIPVTLIDTRKNHWVIETEVKHRTNTVIEAFAVSCCFMVKVQIALLYFNSATAKFSVSEWVDGTILYYWLLHPVHGAAPWTHFIIEPIVRSSFFVPLLTWTVLVVEILLSVFIFMRFKTSVPRLRFLLLGLLLHFGIIIGHGLVSFFFAMAGGLILFTMPIGSNFKINKHV